MEPFQFPTKIGTLSNLRTTKFEYDELGRDAKRELPDGTFEIRAYDAAGNLNAWTKFDGTVINYTYDVNNRVVLKDFPSGTDVTLTYTATGRRKTVDPLELHRYTYALNSPLDLTDPTGFFSVTFTLAVNLSLVTINTISAYNRGGVTATIEALLFEALILGAGGALAAGLYRGTALVWRVFRASRLVGLARASYLARTATISAKFLRDKILRVHGPGSSIPGKSKFLEAFNIRQGIRQTLDSAETLFSPNTLGREGYILIREFGTAIGKTARGKLVTRLKVVLNEAGELITAFPIR